ncbi:LytR/AlgR family response regulator transcription factor [Eudoraea chungangensis]|uniref:LytR/AlgR family response regulator transcription factor n=1 Tax=Eudoraea chungangensis TaxID=1481905 RepID=UPI0023EB2A08|nr:LytTR family DNA-binding domain-containing protein [Eudoraea chungangensis]
MKVVIVEDELAASENLTYLLKKLNPTIEVLTVLDSVRSSVAYFSAPNEAELVFMDIHLADGLSFEIFDKVPINKPVVFTTAYDQYALKAFKVNSIDYLLKPVDEEELAKALKQFEVQSQTETSPNMQMEGLLDLIKANSKSYKTTYLVSQRDQLIPIKSSNFAYLYIYSGIVKAVTKDNKSYTLDKKLEDIEKELDPSCFFRANRQFIVHKDAIANIKYYFNGKLLLNVLPASKEKIVVSKAKSKELKTWLNS